MQSLLLQQPPPPEERIAYERWLKYFEEREEFDRRVCTGPIIHGMIMPANNTQHQLIQKHSEELYSLVDMELQMARVPDGVSYEARKQAQRDWQSKHSREDKDGECASADPG
jgi:hypothetical protein